MEDILNLPRRKSKGNKDFSSGDKYLRNFPQKTRLSGSRKLAGRLHDNLRTHFCSACVAFEESLAKLEIL